MMARLLNFFGKLLLLAFVVICAKQALIYVGLEKEGPSLSELMKPEPAPIVFTIQDYSQQVKK